MTRQRKTQMRDMWDIVLKSNKCAIAVLERERMGQKQYLNRQWLIFFHRFKKYYEYPGGKYE